MEIIGSIKTYEWGKIGIDSEVAKLAILNDENFEISNSTAYAEFWIGDHESGSSLIKSTNQTLTQFLNNSSKDLIGGHTKLPFLFKVLSINKALSIQVHPNKAEAERLHTQKPDIYKDSNHKPELAIALTQFTALCGFRPYSEIYKFFKDIPPLTELVGEEYTRKLKDGVSGLKICYSKLLTSHNKQITHCIKAISENYNEILAKYKLYKIFNRISKDFPNDVGILSLFFFNLIKLKPGESIFLPANIPHAYLEGDCIECMACSDNVIRAGLTPKYKDVETLLTMLNYNGESAEEKLFKPEHRDDYVQIFAPKIEDFSVVKFNFPSSLENYKWQNLKYGSILLVLEGQRILKTETLGNLNLIRGSAIFIPANCGDFISFDKNAKYEGDFVAYLASYNSFTNN